ncbi:MAG: hypothetical protein H0U84_09500 [Thermoleophilaceae bacterium]|nr:hypothetical protein [Thermoleophilaceae bacterium]
MEIHANAALSLKQRLRLARRVVVEGWSLSEAAEVSERTAGEWAGRYRAEGESGLLDRCSAPHVQRRATPVERVEAIVALRRLRMPGAEIAECLQMALSTVQGILTRVGLGKLSRLEPPESANRYQRQRPGELIHIDVKKLGRIGHKGPGHRVSGHRKGNRSRAPVGSSCMSASTTPPAWPMSRCSATSRPLRRSRSCAGRCASTERTALGSSG